MSEESSLRQSPLGWWLMRGGLVAAMLLSVSLFVGIPLLQLIEIDGTISGTTYLLLIVAGLWLCALVLAVLVGTAWAVLLWWEARDSAGVSERRRYEALSGDDATLPRSAWEQDDEEAL